MCNKLGDLLGGFDRQLGCIYYFVHILNIAAKAILKQFDVSKAKAGEVLSKAEQALADKDLENNFEGGFDICTDLSLEEIKQLEAAVLPMKKCLAKVCGQQTGHVEDSPRVFLGL